MTDRQFALLVLVLAVAAACLIGFTAGRLRRRRERILVERANHAARTKGDAGRALVDDHGDDLMALADTLGFHDQPVHEQCRRRFEAGFVSNIHPQCLHLLRRETNR